MKLNLINLFLVGVVMLFATSCIDDDYSKQIEKWKSENDTYFVNMKDSANYQAYTIPTEQGGGIFYYKIKKQGNTEGESPAETDKVTVNYKGMLINGNVFDGTFKGVDPTLDAAATPRTFTVNQLIPGWVLNLKLMKVGEIRTIVLPYYLAYGTMSAGSILPYSTLRFDMQLISIQKTIVE
ncbi:MAG: FKBP-type peptidyl-prolyl cis-trans isomerase [Paludibacter sp.]